MAATATPLNADAGSFQYFHTVELPARLAAGNGPLAYDDVAALGSLAVTTPAGAYTFIP